LRPQHKIYSLDKLDNKLLPCALVTTTTNHGHRGKATSDIYLWLKSTIISYGEQEWCV